MKELYKTSKGIKRKERKPGDFVLILELLNLPQKKFPFTDRYTTFLFIVKYGYLIQRAVVNFTFTKVFRKNAGINHNGVIISLASCLFLLSFNCKLIPAWSSLVGLIYIPWVCFDKSYEEIMGLLFIDVHSIILSVYTVILIINSCISIVKMYMFQTNDDMSCRGTSLIYLGLRWVLKKLRIKRIRVQRQFIESVCEPLLLITVGSVLYSTDTYAAIYCYLMAFSEISIQVINTAYTLKEGALKRI